MDLKHNFSDELKHHIKDLNHENVVSRLAYNNYIKMKINSNQNLSVKSLQVKFTDSYFAEFNKNSNNLDDSNLIKNTFINFGWVLVDFNTIKYICVGNNFVSMDGEFNDFTIDFNLISSVEDILKSIDSIDLTKYVFTDFIDTQVQLNIFKIAFLIYYRDYGKLINHINPIFKMLMESAIDTSKNIIYINIMKEICEKTMNQYPAVTFGVKLVPLSKGAEGSFNRDDLNIKDFYEWRELYCAKRATDLVVNMVTPCLPISIDFIIVKTDPIVYNNPNMKNRIERSDKIIKSIDTILDVYNNNKPLWSDTFNYAIDEPLSFIENKLVLSYRSLVTFSEVVGKTFGFYVQNIQNGMISNILGLYSDSVPHLKLADRSGHLNKYVFEFIYTLYCLNTLCNIIQGDLHLNNCTLYKYSAEPIDQNSHIAYIIDDIIYMLPNTGLYGCIIDFSRSICEMKADVLEASATMFYINYMPEFWASHENTIKAKILQDTELFFKLYTASDMYIWAIKSSNLLSGYPDAMFLIRSIINECTKYLTTYMISAKHIDDFIYPNRHLISYLFDSQYKYDLKTFKSKFTKKNLNPDILTKKDIINQLMGSGHMVKSIDEIFVYPPSSNHTFNNLSGLEIINNFIEEKIIK
jgi:hypothetical protein